MKIGKQNAGSFVSKDNDPEYFGKDLMNSITKAASYIKKRQTKGSASYIVLSPAIIRPYEDAIDKERE